MPLARKLAMNWGPALAYMALIWWLSSRQVHVSLDSVPLRDKGVHFMEYTALGIVLSRATLGTWPQVPLRAALSALIATFAWGVLDELHQAFVPGRSADATDVVADAIGAVSGVLLFAGFWTWLRRRRRAAPCHDGDAGEGVTPS